MNSKRACNINKFKLLILFLKIIPSSHDTALVASFYENIQLKKISRLYSGSCSDNVSISFISFQW